ATICVNPLARLEPSPLGDEEYTAQAAIGDDMPATEASDELIGNVAAHVEVAISEMQTEVEGLANDHRDNMLHSVVDLQASLRTFVQRTRSGSTCDARIIKVDMDNEAIALINQLVSAQEAIETASQDGGMSKFASSPKGGSRSASRTRKEHLEISGDICTELKDKLLQRRYNQGLERTLSKASTIRIESDLPGNSDESLCINRESSCSTATAAQIEPRSSVRRTNKSWHNTSDKDGTVDQTTLAHSNRVNFLTRLLLNLT
ncbi:hypothetical protein CYMTET_25378, partial [Cymbomonas tetramitiformis]